MVYKKLNQCYCALGASVNICSAWQENHKNVKNAINVDIKVMAATAGGSFLLQPPPTDGSVHKKAINVSS